MNQSVRHRTALPSPFASWLLHQKQRQDDIGRLAREAAKDRTFPRTAARLWLFLHYYDLEPINRASVKRAHAEWRKIRHEVCSFCGVVIEDSTMWNDVHCCEGMVNS